MFRWISLGFTAGLAATLALALSSMLAAAPPAPASEIIITVDPSLPDPQVGVPFTVGFTIVAQEAGSRPALAPLVVAHNYTTGDQVTVAARPDRAPGHYAAMLILPSAGQWEWGIQPYGQGEGTPVPMGPLQVTDPAAGPSGPDAVAFWLVVAAILLGPLAVIGWALLSGQAWGADAGRGTTPEMAVESAREK